MARYGQAFKDKAVARMLPPESAPAEEVALEVGVSASTLERWHSQALAQTPGKSWSGRTRDWSPIAAVTLNPERDTVVATALHSQDIQPKAA